MTYSSSAGAKDACAECGSETVRLIDGAGFDEARELPRDLSPGDHATLVYSDPAAIAPFCARYLAEGVDRGEHVFAAVIDDVRSAIESALPGEAADAIDWQGSPDIYADFDPEDAASNYEAAIAGDARPTRILAGLGPESAAEVDSEEFDRYERLAHGIITRRGATVVCLYDERFLSPELLAVAVRTHGLAVHDGSVYRNESFQYAAA